MTENPPQAHPYSDDNLVWIDLEMTGLDARKNRIIEIAVAVTDRDLSWIEPGPDLIIHQPESVLDGMNEWNRETHGKSGLLKLVRSSNLTVKEAEKQVLTFIEKFTGPGKSPLCGNSVHKDRAFLNAYMKQLNNFLHYRIIDISTIKELCRRWRPDIPKFEKSDTHRAIEDIRESIEELRFYKSRFFQDQVG